MQGLNLVLSLPKEKGLILSHLYLYQGLEAQDSDIFLASIRTTWLVESNLVYLTKSKTIRPS